MEKINWVRKAQKRAEARTFEVQKDAKGRAILSFWVARTPEAKAAASPVIAE